MKKIAVITSTRADYGLLQPLVIELRKKEDNNFKVEFVVTGTHLSEEYGYTVNEIEKAGVRIDKRVSIGVGTLNALNIAQNEADAVVRFTELFEKEKYDAICILGDRYEMLMVAIAALNTNTPVFHLCGGDTTEGAVDEAIRHAITKMSYLHFVTNEESRKRVIQLGESPDRVFNVGSTSIDNIKKLDLLEKKSVLESIGLDDCNYIVGTYHPVTLEDGDVEKDIMEFIHALEEFRDIRFIITKSNADKGGQYINEVFDRESHCVDNLSVYDSLGVVKYLSLMKHAICVIGNSSSGIIEAPAMHVTTINIGDRQKGRAQCDSIINCGKRKEEIIATIKNVIKGRYKEKTLNAVNPYGNGDAAIQISDIISKVLDNKDIELKKAFYIYDT